MGHLSLGLEGLENNLTENKKIKSNLFEAKKKSLK